MWPVCRPVVEVPSFDIASYMDQHPSAIAIQAPVKGQMLWEIDVDDVSKAPSAGKFVEADKPVGYIQTWYGPEPVIPAVSGRIIIAVAGQGSEVEKGEILALLT